MFLTIEQFDTALRIAGIVGSTLVVSWIFSLLVQKLLSGIMHIQRVKSKDKRIMTIGRVIHSTGYFVIILIALVLILRELSIDPTPIIASAGVAGLAVSFGAQSLIKDVFAGLCILMEDQYGVGDSVRLDDVSGTVEGLTLRKTVLVDADGGTIHVPHGQVRIVKVESTRNSKP